MLTVEASCLGGYDVNFADRILLTSYNRVRVAVTWHSFWAMQACCGKRRVTAYDRWFFCECGEELTPLMRYNDVDSPQFLGALEHLYSRRYDVLHASLHAHTMRAELARLLSTGDVLRNGPELRIKR